MSAKGIYEVRKINSSCKTLEGNKKVSQYIRMIITGF